MATHSFAKPKRIDPYLYPPPRGPNDRVGFFHGVPVRHNWGKQITIKTPDGGHWVWEGVKSRFETHYREDHLNRTAFFRRMPDGALELFW
jgi:hypothetical protein